MLKDPFMTFNMLIPTLNFKEVAIFSQLNKKSHHMINKIVNFKVYLEAQGIKVSHAKVEESKISATKALQIAAK